MYAKFLFVVVAVFIQSNLSSGQWQWVPTSRTADEMRNPSTWYWPYANAAAEGYQKYFRAAGKFKNELPKQPQFTNAFSWGGQAKGEAGHYGEMAGQWASQAGEMAEQWASQAAQMAAQYAQSAAQMAGATGEPVEQAAEQGGEMGWQTGQTTGQEAGQGAQWVGQTGGQINNPNGQWDGRMTQGDDEAGQGWNQY